MSDGEFVQAFRDMWKSPGSSHILEALVENWFYDDPSGYVKIMMKLRASQQLEIRGSTQRGESANES